MFTHKIFYRWALGSILLVALLLTLVSCGDGSDDEKPLPTPQRITTTPVPTGTRTPVPTWTPSNTPAQADTPTPGPTFTPRSQASATPQPVTGAQRLGQDQTIVTVLEPDLNVSLTNVHQTSGLALLPVAPVIFMRHEGWLEIQFTIYNEYMEAESLVSTLARLGARDGQLTMNESRGDRRVEGVMIDEESVSIALELVLDGINNIVVNLVPAPVGSYEISSVTTYPGFLQVLINQ